MSRSVPQTNYAEKVDAAYDKCWTPRNAYTILRSYIPENAVVWECATGEGWLARWIREGGNEVVESDVKEDFLSGWEPPHWDVIVTNVPFSLKYKFLRRAYELGKPFALLVPYSTTYANTAKKIRDSFGASFEELRPNKRINFYMAGRGGSGFCNNGAQMTTEWLCWKLLPSPVIDVDLPDPDPEHRLIKPPKRTGPTHEEILEWVQSRNPQTHEEIVLIIEHVLAHGIPGAKQNTKPPPVFQSESPAIQPSLLSLWEGQ